MTRKDIEEMASVQSEWADGELWRDGTVIAASTPSTAIRDAKMFAAAPHIALALLNLLDAIDADAPDLIVAHAREAEEAMTQHLGIVFPNTEDA